MSESNRSTLSPAELRHQGVLLLRECWLPILITVMLSALPTLIGQAVLHLSPADMSTLEGLAAAQTGSQYTTFALIASIVIQLAGTLLLSPTLILGLNKGLLAHLRGNRCTLACIGAGFSRWKTVIALELLTSLRILGYLILGGIGQYLLSYIPVLGGIAGGIGYWVLIWWAAMRYMLADCHLADDAEHTCTASDCLDYSVADVREFSVTGLIEVIWPALLPTFIANLLTQFMPASIGVALTTTVLEAAASAFAIAGCAAVYAHLRHLYIVAGDEPISDGLARARALAAGQEYTEE